MSREYKELVKSGLIYALGFWGSSSLLFLYSNFTSDHVSTRFSGVLGSLLCLFVLCFIALVFALFFYIWLAARHLILKDKLKLTMLWKTAFLCGLISSPIFFLLFTICFSISSFSKGDVIFVTLMTVIPFGGAELTVRMNTKKEIVL